MVNTYIRITIISILLLVQKDTFAEKWQLLSIQDEFYFPYSDCLATHVDLNTVEKFSMKLSVDNYANYKFRDLLDDCTNDQIHSTYIILSNYNRFGQFNADSEKLSGKQVKIKIADQLYFDDGISMQIVFETSQGLILYLDLLFNHEEELKRKQFICEKLVFFAETNNDSILEENLAKTDYCRLD